jgi:hypothetical protein
MKLTIITLGTIALLLFNPEYTSSNYSKDTARLEVSLGSSFSLINDTKNKVSIHTGSGFVSLNKGSKTSISCNAGKEVRWANKGKKGDVIFKIESKHCGKTLKLSKLIN